MPKAKTKKPEPSLNIKGVEILSIPALSIHGMTAEAFLSGLGQRKVLLSKGEASIELTKIEALCLLRWLGLAVVTREQG